MNNMPRLVLEASKQFDNFVRKAQQAQTGETADPIDVKAAVASALGLVSDPSSKDGFKFERITSNLTPPTSLQAMIDAKNTAVQTALTAENQVKTAQANAKIAVAEAQGLADAQRIEADGINYYNQKVQQSLTPLLVEKMRIERWDGKYPNTMLGSGSNTMFNIK